MRRAALLAFALLALSACSESADPDAVPPSTISASATTGTDGNETIQVEGTVPNDDGAAYAQTCSQLDAYGEATGISPGATDAQVEQYMREWSAEEPEDFTSKQISEARERAVRDWVKGEC